MVKCRGFKPGGVENPYYFNRRKITVPEGSTIKERLQRSTRPTWEELRKITNKSSDDLDNYNNDKNNEYKKMMNEIREKKLLMLKNTNNIEIYETKRKRSNSFDRSTPNDEYLESI